MIPHNDLTNNKTQSVRQQILLTKKIPAAPLNCVSHSEIIEKTERNKYVQTSNCKKGAVLASIVTGAFVLVTLLTALKYPAAWALFGFCALFGGLIIFSVIQNSNKIKKMEQSYPGFLEIDVEIVKIISQENISSLKNIWLTHSTPV